MDDQTTKVLFGELLRVSLYPKAVFSFSPTEKQWYKIFVLARQQALVGVCFRGVYEIKTRGVYIPSILYNEWLANASDVQLRNERLNYESQTLCELIEKKGYSCCVLKGQAVAGLYDQELRFLRQAGDIDLWIPSSPPPRLIDIGESLGHVYFYDYHHADITCFNDTEVELHYRPTLSRNLIRNTKLQRWFKKENENLIVKDDVAFFPVLRDDANLILIINHIYWHLLYEGVGLRQMMDLYFLLKNGLSEDRSKYFVLLQRFSLLKFAKASMWVLGDYFGLEKKYFVCETDEACGKFLLKEILLSGNFGHYDIRIEQKTRKNKVVLLKEWFRHNLRLMRFCPIDVLWTPIGIAYISLWRRWNNLFIK